MWGIFKQHHYLSAEFNKASHLYLAYWGDVLIGWCTVLAMPSGTNKNAFRCNRLVILPDYQNLGIGTKFAECIGDLYLSQGKKYYMRTSHVRLKRHFENSPLWVATATNGVLRKTDDSANYNNYHADLTRVCASFEYVGKDYATKHHKAIVIDDNQSISKEELIELKNKYYLTIITGKPKEDNATELLCKELGIRTEQLYRNVKGKLVKKEL